MDRRLVIAMMFLVLALLCLLLVGMSSAMLADGTAGARAANAPGSAGSGAPARAALPQPSPMPAPQVAGDTTVAAPKASGAGPMSGEFARTHLACLSGDRTPSIYVPSERWFHGHPEPWRHIGGRVRASGSLQA